MISVITIWRRDVDNRNSFRTFSSVHKSLRRSSHLERVVTMFEAKLLQVGLLKKILESVKDLVTSANFDCTAAGFGLHAMDSSHIALVSLLLRQDAFEHFRCDKNRSLGKCKATFDDTASSHVRRDLRWEFE